MCWAHLDGKSIIRRREIAVYGYGNYPPIAVIGCRMRCFAYHAISRLELLPSLGNDQDLVFRPIISVHHGTVDQNDMGIAQPLKL
jgi:hypothetical protein